MEEISNQTLHSIIKGIKEDTGEIKKHIDIQNGRIGKLEQWRSLIIGGSIVVNAIVVPLVIKLFLDR